MIFPPGEGLPDKDAYKLTDIDRYLSGELSIDSAWPDDAREKFRVPDMQEAIWRGQWRERCERVPNPDWWHRLRILTEKATEWLLREMEKTSEAAEPYKRRNFERLRANLSKLGGCVTYGELPPATLSLGPAIHIRHMGSGALLTFGNSRGTSVFPVAQFGRDGRIIENMRAVSQAFGRDAVLTYNFLAEPHPDLDGHTPFEELRDGLEFRVPFLAEAAANAMPTSAFHSLFSAIQVKSRQKAAMMRAAGKKEQTKKK
jgi:hypothetical protein